MTLVKAKVGGVWVPMPGGDEKVDKTTTIATTAPLTGGGDLASSLSLGVTNFVGSAPGVVPTSPGGTTTFLRSDGSWAIPPGAGGGISGVAVQDNGSTVVAAATSFNFGNALDVANVGGVPTIVVDLGEYAGAGLAVVGGGTGVSSLASGFFLHGNGTGAVQTTKAVPAGVVVGTTDAQILSNKTLAGPVISSPSGLVKADVGLSNVDNTSDVNKPISNAQATVNAAKFDKAGGVVTGATTFNNAVTAASFVGDGAALINLKADSIVSGTLDKARLPTIIDANTTGTAARLTTLRTIALSGDVTGSVSFDGSQNVTIAATIAPDSVALGTDTVGSYIATLTGTANRVIVNGVVGESAAFTLTGPQDIDVLASPTFKQLNLTQTVGAPPLIVQSPTKVVNLNVDRLDDLEGTYYLDWANFTAKPDPTISLTLTGPVTGSASKLWTDLNGNVDLSLATSIPGGAGSGLDADKLDGQDGTFYTNATNIVSGTLSSGRLTGTYTISIIGSVQGAVTGNASTASALQTPRTIAGKTFDGTQNVVLSALTRGNYLTGANYDGSAATTWAVDAVSTNTASKVVARDASGDFAANVVSVSRLSSSVITGTPPLSVLSTTFVPNLNVQYLNSKPSSEYASREEMEALLGDLRLVGAYDAASYTGSWASMPPSRLLSRMSSEPLLLDAHNVATYANLIPNPAFLGAAVGGYAPEWVGTFAGTVTAAAQSIGTTDVRTGEQWQRITGTYDSGDVRLLSPSAAITTFPGANYRIVATVRGAIPANVQVRLACSWSSDGANANVTLTETVITPVAGIWNTFTVIAKAPLGVGGAFCRPSLRVYGTAGAVALVVTVDVARMEFIQAPELVNTGQAGNAVMIGANMPVLHPEADESYFWFPGTNGNALQWTYAGGAADPGVDWRARIRWDGHAGRESRVWNTGLFMGLSNNTVYVMFHSASGEFPGVSMTMPDGSPTVGEWIDLRGYWNASSDTLTVEWKPATGNLFDSFGWNVGATAPWPGKAYSNVSRLFQHGIGDGGGQHFRGAVQHTALYINGALVGDINASALADPSVASFVAASGQTVTILRTGELTTQLIPARFYDGRSVALLSTGNYLSVADDTTLNFNGSQSMTVLLTHRQSSTPLGQGRYLYKYGVGGTTPGYMIATTSPVTSQRAVLELPAVVTASRPMSATADRRRKTWGLSINRATDLLYLIDDGVLSTGVAVTDGATLVNAGPLQFGVGANGTTSPASYEFMTALMIREALSAADLQEFVDALARSSDLYQHGTYWVCSSPGTLDYLDSDWSLRYDITDDDSVNVFNGDWILCFDPLFGEVGHEVGTWHPRQEMVFQYVPFSAETYVKSRIADHLSAPDPHDQYVLWAEGVTTFAPFSHNHPDEINDAIIVHEGKADPHSQYLREIEGNALYMPINRNFDSAMLDFIAQHEAKTDPHQQYLLLAEGNARYETIGSVTSHEAKADPHPIYLTASEADTRYDVAGKLAEHEAKVDPHPQYLSEVEGLGLFAPLFHYHDDRYYDKVAVDELFNIRVEDEVAAADVAQSARVFIGGMVKPTSPQIGDIWFSAPNADQLVPSGVTGFSFVATSSTSITLNWLTWPAASNLTSISLESSPTGSAWTPVSGSPLGPGATTYLDSAAITENLVRHYRIRGNNPVGSGPWSTPLVANAANLPPPPPTALVASGQTPTSIVFSWTAPTWSDPGLSGARYEVFRNGVSFGYVVGTLTNHTFINLTENTQYTLGVRSIDSGGLTSAVVTLNSAATKTTNAPPANAPFNIVITPSTTMPSVTTSWTAPTLPSDFLNYEVQVVRTSGGAVLQTKTTTALTATFDEVAWSTQVFTRIRVMDALGAGSDYANSADVTTRANPAVTMGTPTLAASTDITITWAAPAVQVADFSSYTLQEYAGPSGTTVLRTFAKGAALTHTFDDMPYSTSRRYAVKVERAGSLATLPSAYSPSISTIADPIPTSVAASASGNTVSCTFAAPTAGEPLDSSTYRVRLWVAGSVVAEATPPTKSHTFTGLSYSTGYQVDVRLERANGQHSSYVLSGYATTGPNPDTTPPGNATITAFRPFNNHGEMHIQGYWPGDGDFVSARVHRWYSNGPGWQVINHEARTPGAFFSIYCGNIPADYYMEIAIDVIDARGNERRVPHSGYTVTASPTYVYADATNSWRPQNGGYYNVPGEYRMYQGYYTNSSYWYIGYLYYGYKIANACAGKTVWAMELWLQREGGGPTGQHMVKLYMHDALSSPGTVQNSPNHTIYGDGFDWGTLEHGEAQRRGLSGQMLGDLANGIRRGIAMYQPSGKPYMYFYSLSAQPAQGQVAVHHLG